MKIIYWSSLGRKKGVDIVVEGGGNYWYNTLKSAKKDFSPKEYQFVRI